MLQLFGVRAEQGRLGELEPALRELADRYPAPTLRCRLAVLYAELGPGRAEDAHREVMRVADATIAPEGPAFARLPRDNNWLGCIAHLAWATARLCDVERAAILYDHLLSFADREIVSGAGLTAIGLASHWLGVPAASLGREEAARHFEDALTMGARLGARPQAARTQYEYAAMLAARLRADDRDRARALAEHALATAEELGMAHLRRVMWVDELA